MPPNNPNTPNRQRERSALTFRNIVLLGLALILPAFALGQLSQSWGLPLTLGTAAVLSLIAFWRCGADKRKAQNNQWRTPETTLHLLELLGGWPGSYLAQRYFRHKTSKLTYQLIFWLIILLHQLLAWDYLNHWQLLKKIIGA